MERDNEKQWRKQLGFTLIELLVAMSISAVVLVLAYQAIAQVTEGQERVVEHADRFEQLQRTIWWLEQDTIQMAPRTVADGYGGQLPAYSYRSDLGLELSRLAIYPSPNAQGGLVRVGYQLEAGVLYRLTWPVIDRAADTQPSKLALLTEIVRFQVRMLDDENRWQTSWPMAEDAQAEQSLPKAVEFTLQLQDLGEVKRIVMGVE